MDLADLPAQLAAHKGPLLAAAGGGVLLLALTRRRKAAAGPAVPTSLPAMAGVAGGYSGGAQGAGMTGAAYDSTSSDLYGALSPQLASIGSQLSALTNAQTATSPTPVPAHQPIAATLFAPSGSGTYVRYGSSIGEVESDGSLFAPTEQQWHGLYDTGARFQQLSGRDQDMPTYYTTAANLATRNPPIPVPAPAA